MISTLDRMKPIDFTPPCVAPRRPICIALCSPVMRSGKSTVAEHLQQQHGFALVKFAAGLKSMTRTLLDSLGYSTADINRFVEGTDREYVLPEIGVTTRHIMQTLGTEWGRNCIGENLWADITQSRIKNLLAQGCSVVVDDMRFINEMDAIHAIGGVCYRIIRPDAPTTQAAVNHASEGGLDGVHMPEIWNTEDVPYLIDKVEALLHSL